MNERAKAILDFWFIQSTMEDWFKKDDSYDQKIKQLFLKDLKKAINNEYDEWQDTAEECVALVILLDQFSRNLFRNNAKTFAQDYKTRLIVNEAIDRGYLEELDHNKIHFLLMPLIHSEDISDHIFGHKLIDAYLKSFEHFDKVIDIDQSPIGRTPRSNPATYTGIFTGIRELFVGTQESRSRGYKVGRFSFNVKGGRCEACQGDGVIKVEMHFLPDVYVPCDVCKGQRYNRETLEVQYKGKNIHQVLEMTVEDAHDYFDKIPAIARKLKTLMDVGLSYIRLGQAATTLSGGEAQRVKLARELSKRDTGKTLYILDEPTTGLHFADIEQLLVVLHRLRDHGNTIVVIEHNLDVIKTADWIIDLGPEGGAGGGEILIAGTPDEVAECERSHTGHYLKPLLSK